jgi:RING finger protein 121
MWVIPPLFALYTSSWRFVLIWAVFAGVNGGMVWKSGEKPLSSTTPRMVYKWFATVYSFTYGLGERVTSVSESRAAG